MKEVENIQGASIMFKDLQSQLRRSYRSLLVAALQSRSNGEAITILCDETSFGLLIRIRPHRAAGVRPAGEDLLSDDVLDDEDIVIDLHQCVEGLRRAKKLYGALGKSYYDAQDVFVGFAYGAFIALKSAGANADFRCATLLGTDELESLNRRFLH